LRTHKYDEDTRCAVGEKYPFSKAANISIDSIVKDKEGIVNIVNEIESENKEDEDQSKQKSKKKKAKQEKEIIKTIICKMVPYITPIMAEH